MSNDTYLIDQALTNRLPPNIPDDRSVPHLMEDIQEIIDSCFLRPRIPQSVRNLEDTEISQIEIILYRLSSQLKSWKKLVQYFYVINRNKLAAEQLISNVCFPDILLQVVPLIA